MKREEGLKIKPCGTPLSMLASLESTPETEQTYLRSDNYDQLIIISLLELRQCNTWQALLSR